MRKLILLLLFILITTSAYCGLRRYYTLKIIKGDVEIYILPNGMGYEVNRSNKTIKSIYLDDKILSRYKYKSMESLNDFIETLEPIKCETIKGVNGCVEVNEEEE